MMSKIKGLIKVGVGIGIVIFIILQLIFQNKSVISNISTAMSITTIGILVYCIYLNLLVSYLSCLELGKE